MAYILLKGLFFLYDPGLIDFRPLKVSALVGKDKFCKKRHDNILIELNTVDTENSYFIVVTQIIIVMSKFYTN